MANWEYWFKEGDTFTPVEFNDDGTLKCVVLGMCLITSMDEMKKRAKKIWEVNDVFEPTKAELIWDSNNAH